MQHKPLLALRLRLDERKCYVKSQVANGHCLGGKWGIEEVATTATGLETGSYRLMNVWVSFFHPYGVWVWRLGLIGPVLCKREMIIIGLAQCRGERGLCVSRRSVKPSGIFGQRLSWSPLHAWQIARSIQLTTIIIRLGMAGRKTFRQREIHREKNDLFVGELLCWLV